MQFKLKTVFGVISVLAILLACYKFIEVNWYAARRTSINAQTTFDRLIGENNWDGIIVPTHPVNLVLISINVADETEIKKLYPSLHEIFWLKHIYIDRPIISQAMMDELHLEFPGCTIDASVHD
jgi:hypothetical protein